MRLRAAQPAARRHDVERVGGLLEVTARRLEADSLDEAARALADLGGEHAGEVAHAHAGRGGQRGQAVVAPGSGFHQALDSPDRRPLGPGHPDG